MTPEVHVWLPLSWYRKPSVPVELWREALLRAEAEVTLRLRRAARWLP